MTAHYKRLIENDRIELLEHYHANTIIFCRRNFLRRESRRQDSAGVFEEEVKGKLPETTQPDRGTLCPFDR
jgi:hypothetical protein